MKSLLLSFAMLLTFSALASSQNYEGLSIDEIMEQALDEAIYNDYVAETPALRHHGKKHKPGWKPGHGGHGGWKPGHGGHGGWKPGHGGHGGWKPGHGGHPGWNPGHPGHGPGWNPGHPGHGPGWGHGPNHGTRYVCVTRNGMGRRFTGVSRFRTEARMRALRQCRINSFRPISCRLVRCQSNYPW